MLNYQRVPRLEDWTEDFLNPQRQETICIVGLEACKHVAFLLLASAIFLARLSVSGGPPA